MHLRITGSAWLLVGAVGAICCAAECVRLLRNGELLSEGGVVVTFIAMMVCASAVGAGYGLLMHRRWARLIATLVAIPFCLYFLSFVMMAGMELGAIAFAASWLGLVLVANTIAVVVIWKPYLPPPGHCHKCSYNLTGNTSGVCPECGSRVPASSTPASPPLK